MSNYVLLLVCKFACEIEYYLIKSPNNIIDKLESANGFYIGKENQEHKDVYNWIYTDAAQSFKKERPLNLEYSDHITNVFDVTVH
jgi:glutamine synthetase